MTADVVLSATGIEFSYGPLQVLFGPSFELEAGEALALLGTNGAGKSTLLRVVAGLAVPMSGRVCLMGHEVTGMRAEQVAARGLGFIQGGRAVFSDLTVRENLEMQALLLKDKELAGRRRDQVLATFPRLAERLVHRAGTLSGGEQQQLALAKAMLHRPTVLLIDELSLGLAPVVVAELLELVRALHRDGTAIVLVEQSLNIAASLCDRAVFMEKGQIRFEGSTRELLERDDIARAVFLGAV